MNRVAATLAILVHGDMSPRALASRVGVKYRQMDNILTSLERDGYVTRRRGIATMSNAPKAVLLRDLARVVDIGRLLGRSNEAVLAEAGEAGDTTAEEIARATGLSRSTVARSVANLLSAGALVRRGGGIAVNPTPAQIRQFAALLKLEGYARYVDGTEIIYNRDSLVIRKVLAGRAAKGEPTGFTAFGEHGIDYVTTHDYFCDGAGKLALSDILLHAVLEASRLRNGADMLMCMVFYTKHKDGLDVTQVRAKAANMGLLDVWLDIEAYVRGEKTKDAKLFLPWAEFEEKLALYDIHPSEYLLPRGHNSLFKELNDALDAPVTAYLLGGENMRLKGLKNRTKDCDIAVDTAVEFEAIKNALVRIGYSPTTTVSSDEDERILPDALLTHPFKSRIDLFTRTIARMSLLPRMMEKSNMHDYGTLRLGLLCNEHVFVLKAAAGREGDIQDMDKLVRAKHSTKSIADQQFDWNEVLAVVHEQSAADPTNATIVSIFESVSYMPYHDGMRVPIFAPLRLLVTDLLVKSALRGGSLSIKDAVLYAERRGVEETAARNRIDAMVRDGQIGKTGARKVARIAMHAEAYPKTGRITARRLKHYLNWRFVLREQPLPGDTDELATDLLESGFETVSQVDAVVGSLVDCLGRYEREQLKERHFSAVGAVRVCVGLNDPRLGNDRRSKFFIIELNKYGLQPDSGREELN